ncbi:MarR family transcriptional regulator [Litorivivens sp.]|uniref:MarR family transcriptional regulator n=1 Tax=Litorivivens sp. TaxID=2020868 RepID=UPI00356532F2
MSLPAEQFAPVWEQYRHNFMRHLTAITRHSERRAMEQLTKRGHPRLAMSFSAPLSLLGSRPLRLTELADALGMSKQLCLQSLKPVEKAGYIERRDDPKDKRAKLVALTTDGEQLIQHALEEMQATHKYYETLIGSKAVRGLSGHLRDASKALQVPGEGIRAGNGLPVSARLTPLSRILQERLMAITASLGHNLQFSFGQVLGAIDLGGTAVAELARLNAVTTQAISRIAGELESLGYISRAMANNDRRSRHLRFTAKGLVLIRDSVQSVQTLAEELSATMGEQHFAELEQQLQQLYAALELETGILKPFNAQAAAELFSDTPAEFTRATDKTAALLYLASQMGMTRTTAGTVELLTSAPAVRSLQQLRDIESRLDDRQKRQLQTLLAALNDTR